MTTNLLRKDWLKQANLKNKEALMIGCWLGDNYKKLADISINITTFDIFPTAIPWCNQLFSESSVNYLVADLLTLDYC